jgi:hypothetical protein
MPQATPDNSLPRPRFAFDGPSAGPGVGVNGNFAATDPTVGSDNSARQLNGAIRVLTDTVGSLGDRQDHINAVAEADAAKKERAAEKARILLENSYRGAAAQDGEQWLPSLLNDIKTGTLRPGEKDADPEGFVNRLIEERSAGLGETYTNELKRIVAPRALRVVYAKAQDDERKAIVEQKASLFSRIAMTEDPEQLSSVLGDARKQPGMAEHVDSVAAKAIINFAKNGNEQMVNALKGELGADEVGSQDYAERLLEVAKAKKEAENRKGFADTAANWQMAVLADFVTLQDAPRCHLRGREAAWHPGRRGEDPG